MNYIGIDLGTTNSAICSYNGEKTIIYKSPDQNDVTPSAIFIDPVVINISGNEPMTVQRKTPTMLRQNSSGSWGQALP